MAGKRERIIIQIQKNTPSIEKDLPHHFGLQ